MRYTTLPSPISSNEDELKKKIQNDKTLDAPKEKNEENEEKRENIKKIKSLASTE